MSDQQEKMLERVRALLAKAASTNFEAESETYRQKADELMTKFSIELWQLEQAQARAEGRVSSAKPEFRHMNIDWWWKMDEDLRESLWSVFLAVCHHARCRVANKYAEYGSKTVPVVGLPSDLAYVDLLFTHLFMQMVDTMDPHPHPHEPMIDALVRMKEAGLKWEEIFNRLKVAGYYPVEQRWNPSKMDYAGKYTAYCLEHGRERVRVTPSVYRRSFSSGFASALRVRLRHQAEEQGQTTGSMAVAIRDITALVEQALLDMFPNQGKRSNTTMVRDTRKIDMTSLARGDRAGKQATIIGNDPRVGGGKKELG